MGANWRTVIDFNSKLETGNSKLDTHYVLCGLATANDGYYCYTHPFMPRLTITSQDGKRSIYEMTKPVVTLGRGTANDLVLNDTSVSRFHAVIKTADGKYVIADRGSTNGVYVNSKRITDETPFAEGDSARIGIYMVNFEKTRNATVVLRKADIPSTLDQMIKSKTDTQTSLTPKPPTQINSNISGELVQTIRKLERENYLLTVLYDAGKALSSKLSTDDIGEQVLDLAFRIQGVERGFMMLYDVKSQTWQQSDVRYRKGGKPQSDNTQPGIIMSHAIMEAIETDQQPILITDLGDDTRFKASESVRITGMRSAMVAPLLGATRLFGLIYVDNPRQTKAFTQEELNVFALVASQAGASLDSAYAYEQLAEGAVQRSALERFLSPDVVQMIAENPGGVRLGGVNQKVSIMFADIRGFTPLSEKMQPEKIVEILNEYFTRVTDVIFDNGGMLDKYIGDAVMAVFGAPISKGNDAANAVKAAIELQRLLVEMNRDAVARGWPEIEVGIGINTGIVTAGNIGSPRRLDYTVIGDAVNTASRLMSNAKGFQIIISESTEADIGKKWKREQMPPLTVKGRKQQVNVFEVEWKKQ